VERFWFRLAGHLGCTVREVKLRVTPEEFFAWQAFHEWEPIGADAANTQQANGFALVASAFSGKSVDPKLLLPKPPKWMQKGHGKATDPHYVMAALERAFRGRSR
jgi:hypothetical protein